MPSKTASFGCLELVLYGIRKYFITPKLRTNENAGHTYPPLQYEFSLKDADAEEILATARAEKTFLAEGVRRLEVRPEVSSSCDTIWGTFEVILLIDNYGFVG